MPSGLGPFGLVTQVPSFAPESKQSRYVDHPNDSSLPWRTSFLDLMCGSSAGKGCTDDGNNHFDVPALSFATAMFALVYGSSLGTVVRSHAPTAHRTNN